MPPVASDEALSVHELRSVAGRHQFVAWRDAVLEEFQHAEASVGSASLPIHHAHAGVLRRIADQLAFPDDVNAHRGEAREDISVCGSGEVPVGVRNGLEDEPRLALREVSGGNGAGLVHRGEGGWREPLANGLITVAEASQPAWITLTSALAPLSKRSFIIALCPSLAER